MNKPHVTAGTLNEGKVEVLTAEQATGFAKKLGDCFAYLAIHGWTKPIPEIVRGYACLEALALGKHAVYDTSTHAVVTKERLAKLERIELATEWTRPKEPPHG